MSGSGFRGSGIEPRGICPNGLAGNFRGVHLSHPRFYHPRLPHGRLPAPDNWSGRSNHNVSFSIWTNAKCQRPMFRGKSHFRPNSRGRGTIHRGTQRFSNDNRSSIGSHPTDHNKDVNRPRTVLLQDQYDQDQLEQAKGESSLQQTPLLGSEEERQQKITQTVVRLKEKLSNITKEDITNLWQNDVSTISPSNVENRSILNVGIPTLSHEESELNLTLKDFKDINRIDSNNLKFDKSNDTDVVEHVSNFIQDTVKDAESSPAIEVIDLVDVEENIVHDVESMTVVNDVTEKMSQNDNGQKLQEGTNSLHSISVISSAVSETCDSKVVYSLQQKASKTDLSKDQCAPLIENTQTQDHQLNTKCANKSSHQLEYKNSNDNINLTNIQKSCDDTQHEQVNTIIEMQYSLHRSVSKVTKERSHWTQLPYETSSFRRKPFKSRWLHNYMHDKPRHTYMQNKSKNELTAFDLHAPSPYLHTDMSSLSQDSQYNSSFNLSGYLPSGKFSTIPKLTHNQDNSQSMLCLDHNTSSSISNNVSSNQKHILQRVPAFDSWKSSPTSTCYNKCEEKVTNIPHFNPQQPPPNFNNQKGVIPLSPVFDSHFLSREQSNLNTRTLDSSQLSAASASPTDLYCPVTFSTTQSTTTLSTLSQLSVTSSHNFLSNVPINFSPTLTYATPLQITPYEVPSSATLSNTEHQTLFCDTILDQVPNQDNIVEVKDELEEMQEAMQFAKQAMNITNMNNIEFDQTASTKAHLYNASSEQETRSENVSDVSYSAELHHTIHKEKEKLSKQYNKKDQVIIDSYASSELNQEKQLNKNCNINENALFINEQTQANAMLNLNPKLNKINEEQNVGGERNMHLKEYSSEKKKVECPSPESSWKNRIINRFLKMSKNEIRNMINNCSLRKFDIAMKHLVKEKRSSLSLEMRNAENAKITSYNREEFMNQLNAMLDPTAIVDITNLPTEFIRHLSEVLQLDTIPFESSESVGTQCNNDSQHNNSDVINALYANEQEMLNDSVIPNNINVEGINEQTNVENNNQLEDYCNRITPSTIAKSSNNDNNILDSNQNAPKIQFGTNDAHIDHIKNDMRTSNKNITQKNVKKGERHSLFNITDLDDIFSTVAIKVKGDSKSIILDDKTKSTLQVNATSEVTKISIPTETASIPSIISENKFSNPSKQYEYSSGSEYISKSERYNRWTRREREGPDAFRNLTKEEWEAKYGKHTKSSSNSCEMQTSRCYNNKYKNAKHNVTFISKRHPSPHSFKRNRNDTTDISNKVFKKDKNTETVSSTSNSSDSETDDTSTSSDNRTPSDVTKLLKVIKEKEKIAKNKSINETIRDEVTAEIQRKWNEQSRKRKNHKKDKRRKEKRARYKERRKKRKKILSSNCNSDYSKDDRSSLLTETEIKKETISKEESDAALEKSIKCDIKITNVLTDKRVSLEIKDKSTVSDNDRFMLNPTMIQPKTKAQLKLIPETSKCTQETEFMKNTAKIVLNVKCKENKVATLDSKDKSKNIQKIHQINKDSSSSGINETSECPNKGLIDVTETAHTIFNNNDNTNKNFISASIIEKEHDKEKTSHLAKEVPSVPVEFQESSIKRCMDNKVTSKKIDIKAYKERALQRKIENGEKIKEKNPTLSNNNISQSVTKEKNTCNVDLKEKCTAIQINKVSTDFNKFKNIKSEGKKELHLKKEKVKKKIEKEIRIKEAKETLSVNEENVTNISVATELSKNEVKDNGLNVHHINQDKCLSPMQKVPIQSEDMSVNDIPLKNILTEVIDERNERVVNNVDNTGLVTVIMDKEKTMQELKITDTSIQASKVSNNLKTIILDKNSIEPIGKCDENKIECRTKAISTCGGFLAKHEICNFANIDELSLQKNKPEKHEIDGKLSDCVNLSTDLKLNLMQDVSQINMEMLESSTNIIDINMVSSDERDINLKEDIITNKADQKLLENLDNINIVFSNEGNINLKENITITNEADQKLLENLDNMNVVSPSEQNLNLEEDITITNKADQKLLENLDNFEIQKINSPESVGSPFKGFVSDSVTCSSCQHVEINNVIFTNKDNLEEEKHKKLQSYISDKFNWKNLSNQDTLADNNISSRNGFNDTLDTRGQTHENKEKVLYENVSEINENTAANLNNNTNLLDNGNDKDKTNEKTVQMFIHDCTNMNEYSSENEKSMQSMNVETNIPHTSSKEHKMLMENEYEDNAVMKKSDTNIFKSSCFKEKQSSVKNMNLICASTAISPLDINSTIASSCSEISNETLKNVIDTDTKSSFNSLLEGNIIENYSTFKNMPNQSIINSNNIDLCEEENTNNNDSYVNNSSCANFSINLPMSMENLSESSTKDTSKKLKIPTKAALKESRNVFTIMDDNFSCVKEIIELKDSYFKLNLCNDQKVEDVLSDQISQKENIDNKMINLEQKKCSHNMHTYAPDDKESCKSVDTDSLSKTFLNNIRTINDEMSTSSNHNNYIKESESTNTSQNPIIELEKIKETNKWIKNTVHQNAIAKDKINENAEKLSCKKTNKQEKTNNLHKIKTKQAMKHKMKNKCKSNTVHITNTNIKEEIMARMIEIDMEIHKLMTEKMTLYQMLENDSLLSNKLTLNSNLGSEISKEKLVSLKPQTSSSAVSRIIQTAGTSFGENSDCIVTPIRENISCDISKKQTELKVEDTNGDKHNSLLQDKIVPSHNPEDEMISEDSESAKSLLIFKDEDKMQEDETALSEDQLKESQNSCNSIEETLNNFTESSSSASIPYFEKEEQLCVSSPTDIEPSNENTNIKNKFDGDKKQNIDSGKLLKGKNSIHTSLIYSDDSTWGSFISSLEDMEQKKHNTGLALLEETYKREMAENRKLKANARKKKKKELDTFLKSVNYLTPEEEEIPLNALYIKKLQQKRDLLDTLDDKKESSIIDNSTDLVESEEMWKHAMEVINAVAENRVKDLYTGKTKESEVLTTSSNTIKKNADICKAKILTNLREPLQSLNETRSTISSSSCNQEPNFSKSSFSIEEKDAPQLIEKEEDNENKQSNVQSTVNSSNNLEVNPFMMNTSSDDKVTQGKISLSEQLFNADNSTDKSVPIAVNGLNIADSKLNKNQTKHTFQTSLSNKDTIVSISTSENLKYNDKTEETTMQSTCLLKNKGTIASKDGCDVNETSLNTTNGILNIKSNSFKKCKDHAPKTVDSSEITENIDIPQSSNIHDKKSFKRKNNNKNIPMRKNSRYIEDKIKYQEHTDTNSNKAKDSPTVLLHDSKNVSWADLENESSNVKRNRYSQKLQNIKDKKYINCLENKTSNNDRSFVTNKNLMERYLLNVDSQVLVPKVQSVALKRKVYNQSEMMNCKVILVDVLKSNMYQHIVKKFHTNSTKTHMSYKSTTVEATTNSTSSVTSSLITDTCKMENIPKYKNSCTSNNKLEETTNQNQKYTTKISGMPDNTRELKSRHKLNVPHSELNVSHSNESLLLESNSKDVPVISTKSINLDVKILPEEDKKLEIEILEKRITDQHIVNQHKNEQTLPNATTENEQPLRTQYTVHKGPILDIKVFGDTFLAASEDGSIYRYSQVSNGILNIYKGHRSAVTCLYIHKCSSSDYVKDLVYSGSLDGTLRCYNIKTGASINNVANVGSPVQCMDQAWGIIFIGTKSGHVSRFHIKCGVIKGDSIQFSNQSVLALKATNEGPRKVLIVATRNQPITIRDAQNGLFLRTICGQRNHTVYSLMLNNSLIYCGTSSTSILVFDFTNGEQKAQYGAGVGIVCMRLYHKLLFAGCYDGNIYVFDIEDHRLICNIPGPGNMLLSMEVVDNKIIAGSKDKRLHTWQMPKEVQVVSREVT